MSNLKVILTKSLFIAIICQAVHTLEADKSSCVFRYLKTCLNALTMKLNDCMEAEVVAISFNEPFVSEFLKNLIKKKGSIKNYFINLVVKKHL